MMIIKTVIKRDNNEQNVKKHHRRQHLLFFHRLGSVSERSESHDFIKIRLISKNLRSTTKKTLQFLSYVTYDSKRP